MTKRKKMVTAEEIEEAALKLPRDELGALIERLVASTADEWDEDPQWRQEILRRSGEIEAGTAQTVSAEEVFARMRAARAGSPRP
jgi:putative addiction module component (TIGR02574 family)